MSAKHLLPLALLASALFTANSSNAQVTVVNAPVTSYATLQFDDTTSLNPLLQSGSTYTSSITPWGGATQALAPTTDPVTLDFAQGSVSAAVIAGNYSISLNNVVLNQALANTGNANLIIQFDAQFQIGASGLPYQPTIFPNFAINGTVLSVSGFASVTGSINYYGTFYNTTLTPITGLMETVNYNDLYNTPGNFSAIASGVPVNGYTASLLPGSTLDLVGNLDFEVDPAEINVESIPEPST